MKTLAIVQARMGSTRFPGKVLKELPGGQSLIGFLLARLSKSTAVDKIVVATTDREIDDRFAEAVRKLGYEVYRGSEGDVLDRYYQAALLHNPEVVVRITGDCPLVDPLLVTQVITKLADQHAEYASNTNPPTFPDGLDVEAFTFRALERTWKESKTPYQREHVTPYLREPGNFKTSNVANDTDESSGRWTVDDPADFEVISGVVAHFGSRIDFGWRAVLAFQKQKPELFAINHTTVRNEGATIGTGQKLWKRAKRVIPGGSMLLSKRSEMFLPERWPAYFSKAKGCRIWDLDGREYIDMSLMGIGTNVLGYGHPEVDEAVRGTILAGNLSTLNCPEEVYLAERLIELHPWADMVRTARSGGEANAIATRIARAASGRDTVAICGYHGWHDWYLAANLGNEQNLAGHLLPGLEPKGVPQNLCGSVLPFRYNQFDELLELVKNRSIGAIMMEVSRNLDPQPGFLENIRKLATEKKIVLIFDECTSGFRQTFGGLHKRFGVDPDMAIFGKTLGNGYAITAVIGRRAVMEVAQSTFISSTFWTERIGPTAALKTLEVMERTKSWETITAIGNNIGARWQELARQHGLTITVSGLPSMIALGFPGPNTLKYKTLLTQEMLKMGFLATTAVYACTEHRPEIVDRYFTALDKVFGLIKQCEDGRKIDGLLEGPVCHSGFKRLN